MSELTTRKEGGGPPIQEEMEAVLSSLANEDALKIFQEAKEGITSSTEAIKKLKLTQKRYYARLKPLIEAGLIEKTDSRYKLTFLGKIVYEILYRRLEKALENRDRIALIDKLNKSVSLSKEEKEQIANAISIKERTVGYSLEFSEIKPVEIIRSFADLVELVKDLLEKASEEILFASRYTDNSIVEPFLRAFRRGISIYCLWADEKSFSNRINALRMLLTDPSMIRSIRDLLSSSNVNVRNVDLAYSFAIVDRKYVIFEVPNLIDGSFLYGFLFDNEEISKMFVQVFHGLYEKGEKDPFAQLFMAKFKV
jgi:DNA-binding HxlR family transcriptional regulator